MLRIWWENEVRLREMYFNGARDHFVLRVAEQKSVPFTIEEAYYMGKAAVAVPDVFHPQNAMHYPYWQRLGKHYVVAMDAVQQRIILWLLYARTCTHIPRGVAMIIGRLVWDAREEQMGSVPVYRRGKRRKRM